jgi:predicted dehydrogenase
MRILHVGLGARGRSWIEVCRRQPGVEVVGFVEPDRENRKLAQERFDLPPERIFGIVGAALGSVAADAVLDTTPPGAHEEVAEAAFAAGLHLLQEKPMSDDFAAARRMVAAAERAGRTFMVTQNYRFAPLPRTTRTVLSQGRIGPVALVDMGFYRAWATRQGTHYTTMAYPLLKDMGIHHFDLLRYLIGEDPEQVQATTWNVPWGWHAGDAAHNVTIRFSGGATATHHASGASVGGQTPWHGDLRLEGPEGSLTWEEDRLYFTSHKPGTEATREEIPLDPLPTAGMDGCLAEFVAAVRERREPECSGGDNLKSLAIVFAAVRSAEERRPVKIAELLG